MKRYKPRAIERAYARAKDDTTMHTTDKKYAAWGDRRIHNFLTVEYPPMVEIYRAGRLEETDLSALIRAVFFAEFYAARWQKITAKDLGHRPGCTYSDARVRYTSSSIEPSMIESAGVEARAVWMGLRAAGEQVIRKTFGQELAGATCTVDLKQHQAMCPCGAHVHRLSTHVHITFAGRTVTREYALAVPVEPAS